MAGLTCNGYPLGCAAAAATLDVYESERLVENAAEQGRWLAEALPTLAAHHPSVGDVRGLGLFWALELVADRARRTHLIPPGGPANEAAGMGDIKKALLDQGVLTFLRSNRSPSRRRCASRGQSWRRGCRPSTRRSTWPIG